MFASSLVLFASLFVGCATTEGDYADVKPAITDDGVPTGVEWQGAHDAELAAATRQETLAAFVASDAAADALLAKIGNAYKGDPLVLTQIAAVTQLVMHPTCPKAPACRARWVAALKRAKAVATDDYVKIFCEQQLWQCDGDIRPGK